MNRGSSKNKVKLEVLLHETLAVSLTNNQNVVAGEIKHEKNASLVEMPKLHSHIEEADARIALHVANSIVGHMCCWWHNKVFTYPYHKTILFK